MDILELRSDFYMCCISCTKHESNKILVRKMTIEIVNYTVDLFHTISYKTTCFVKNITPFQCTCDSKRKTRCPDKKGIYGSKMRIK